MRLPRVDQVLVRQHNAAVLNHHARQVFRVRLYGLTLLLLGWLAFGLSERAIRVGWAIPALRVTTGVKQALTKTIRQTAAYTGLSWSPLAVRDISATPVATVSAASFEAAPVAPGALVTSFGVNLATQTAVGADTDPNTNGVQLPTQLGGTSVEVNGRRAGLLFVSPGQLNYIIPAATEYGTANLVVRSSDGTVSNGTVQIVQVAPSTFAANGNGRGVAAAVAVRVKSDGSQAFEAISQFNTSLNSFVTKPIDLGPTNEAVFLVLFATGLRNADDPNNDKNLRESFSVLIGGNQLAPTYVGAHSSLVGVDQINVQVPRSLIGRGIINVSVTANGFNTSNATTIEIAGTASVAPPQVTGFSVTPALAGQELEINGSGFSTNLTANTVRFGSAEAAVMEATPSKLKVIVPYGVETSTVSVRTPQGEGVSANVLQIRTSISGSVENTNRQPLSNVTVRLSNTSIFTTTKSDGSFVLPDVQATSHLVEVDGSLIPTQPPYPKVTLKITAAANRDNQFARAIALQQATGASGTVGDGSSFTSGSPNLGAAEPQQQQTQPTTILLQTGKFSLALPNTLTAVFADNSKRGKIYLTPLQDARTPIDLPLRYYSTSIVQVTPFETRFEPGAKLVLPNSDGLPANTQLNLFRYEPDKGSFEAVEGAKTAVTADGQYIETGDHDIKVSSYYFATAPRATTDIRGRVLCCMTENGTLSGNQPILKAVVEARGRVELTDGNGSYLVRSVPVTTGENVSVNVTYVRPSGRVDRAQSKTTAAVVRGLTNVEEVYLPNENSNREPVILAPIEVEVPLGQTLDVPISIYDPDPNQQVNALVEGAAFATLLKVSSGGTIANPNAYVLRLAPTLPGNVKLTLSATDGQATTVKNVTVIVIGVNRTPTANDQEVSTDEDTAVAIKLTGSDPDGNTLQFAVVRPPSSGTLSGRPPNLTYTPQANFNGADSFSFKVNDGQIDSLPGTVKITVRSVNDPPSLTAPTTATVNEGQLLTINLTATDVDQGQLLTITGNNLPAGAAFSMTSPTSAQFKWTPSFTQAGSYVVTFKATDNGTPPLSDTKEVRITVVDVPALSVPGPQSVNEGQTLVFDVASSTGQGDSTITASGLPDGATLNATGVGAWQFKWTPSFKQAGNYVVTFKATTSSGAESKDVRISVFDVQHELGKEPNDLTIFGAHSPATRDPLDAGDATGASLATGDLNGDGIADLIVGAPAANNGAQDVGKDVGKVYVFFGKTTLGGTLDLAQQKPDLTLIGERTYEAFGASVAVGDVNGDGKLDLLIGAPLADAGSRRDCGKVYLALGGFPPTGLDADKTAVISRVASLTITGANADDRLGTRVAAGNIRSKTGAMDLLASAPGLDLKVGLTDLTLKDAGAVYLFAGGATLVGERDLANTAATFTLTGVTQDAQLGMSLAVGNFNGDDYADFAVGAPTENTQLGKGSGMAYLMLGASNLAGAKTAAQAAYFQSGTSEGDNFGADVALGDINGDGFADLIMGAPGGDGPGNSRPNTGEVYVVFGAAGVPARTMLIRGAGRRDDPIADALGATLAVGDFNGDGIADLLIGAPGADLTTEKRDPLGAAYLILGARTSLPTTYDLAARAADLTIYGAYPGDRLGLGAFAFGNLNGAETADLVLGIPRSASVNNARIEAGEVRVLFGVRR